MQQYRRNLKGHVEREMVTGFCNRSYKISTKTQTRYEKPLT